MRPQAPVLSDAAHPSSDAQKLVSRPPAPFENPYGQLNVPAPTHPYINARKAKDNVYYDGGQPVNPLQKAGGYAAKDFSIRNGTSLDADMMRAVGYEPDDTKSTESIISGHPTKNNSRQTGRPGTVNKGASSREVSRVRQTGY